MSLDKLLANIKSPGSAKSEQRRQLELLAQMNQLHNQSGRDDSILESHISTMETAYRMQIEALMHLIFHQRQLKQRVMVLRNLLNHAFLLGD